MKLWLVVSDTVRKAAHWFTKKKWNWTIKPDVENISLFYKHWTAFFIVIYSSGLIQW